MYVNIYIHIMNILPNILDIDKMYIAVYYSLLINLHLYLQFAQSEPQAVGVHDKIIAVNGVRGTPDEIMGGIRDSKDTAAWQVLTSQSILILVMIIMIGLQKSLVCFFVKCNPEISTVKKLVTATPLCVDCRLHRFG